MASNIARDSKFSIKFNPYKSKNSLLYDDNSQRYYLDLFGMYSSNTLGYNHSVFNDSNFVDMIVSYSKVKVTNCEFSCEESEKFDTEFAEFCDPDKHFSNFHYCCTGSLAVEAAIKTALHYKNYSKLKIITLNNSFHGANSLGIFVTDRIYPAAKKLSGYPEGFTYKVNSNIEEIEKLLQNKKITCVLIEPIRCSAGDIYLEKQFFKSIRNLCDRYNVPLIFDEVQTGFCSTGKTWYYQHLDIIPDIVIFGKKSQVSGIMVNKKLSKIFSKESRTRLDVTFNSDVVDMIRCRFIIKAIKEYNLIDNVNIISKDLINILNNHVCQGKIQNVRGVGLILAFDCENKEARDNLVRRLYDNGVIVNSTGDKSVRVRPNLSLRKDELLMFEKALENAFK